MTAETTPAIERAAQARHPSVWDGRAKIDLMDAGHYVNTPPPTPEQADESIERMKQWAMRDASVALTAALSDPDDPDSLARTLFVLNAGASGWSVPESLTMWERKDAYFEETRVHWRAVADGLRMMLTGSGS
jgi:hypothetical protein